MSLHSNHLPRPAPDRTLCVAPMMRYTDRHFRYLLRLVSPRIMLYTEMLAAATLLHGDRERRLAFDASEHPLALQLGGSDPAALARCARLAWRAGFDEINLNVGCPSSRVREGRFGACLIAEPERVAACVAAMADAVPLPVTVKTRTGINGRESFEELAGFVAQVADAGCRCFIVHARSAWLEGLSPAQNRNVPPLRQDLVHRLKREFADLAIIINGGIVSVPQMLSHLEHVDGVMIGRAACSDPMLLATAAQAIFGPAAGVVSREEVLDRYLAYAAAHARRGTPAALLLRPLQGMFHGRPGARRLRALLAEAAAGRMSLDELARTLGGNDLPETLAMAG